MSLAYNLRATRACFTKTLPEAHAFLEEWSSALSDCIKRSNSWSTMVQVKPKWMASGIWVHPVPPSLILRAGCSRSSKWGSLWKAPKYRL